MRKFLISIIVAGVLFGCSPTTDEDIYNEAQSKFDQGNYAETLAAVWKIVEGIPRRLITEQQALFEIGKLYHGQVVKSLTEEQNYNKAIEFYSKVYKEYPDSSQAPNSLFMIGFLKANELEQLDSARYYYNLFIEKYPDNEMAVSAKAEIENLGIPAEEILKQKAVKK